MRGQFAEAGALWVPFQSPIVIVVFVYICLPALFQAHPPIWFLQVGDLGLLLANLQLLDSEWLIKYDLFACE